MKGTKNSVCNDCFDDGFKGAPCPHIELNTQEIQEEKVEVTERYRNGELIEVKANGKTIFPTQEIQEWEQEKSEVGGIVCKCGNPISIDRINDYWIKKLTEHKDVKGQLKDFYLLVRNTEFDSALSQRDYDILKTFISQKLKEQRSDILETFRKNLDDYCIYEVSAETLLEK